MDQTLNANEQKTLTDAGSLAEQWYHRTYQRVWHEQQGELGYGFFHVPDPRDWCPDLESDTPEEVARWAEACQRWGLGEATVHEPTNPDAVCRADHSFGLGTYRLAVDDGDAWEEEPMPAGVTDGNERP